GVVAHTAIGADGKKSGKPRTRSHNCTFCHTNRPLPLLDVTGSPIVRDYTMDFQILCTRTNVEPFPVIENNAANLAAGPDPISDERRGLQMRLDVFDSASSPEQFRFVHEPHWPIAISPVRECIRELLRQTVRVDDERFDAEVDQMIERERDERLLENGDERLG